MKRTIGKTARNNAVALTRGFSQRTIRGSAAGDFLSLAPDFSPVRLLRRMGGATVSLAPGFSRVESGGGNEKTVLTVFLKRATLSENQ